LSDSSSSFPTHPAGFGSSNDIATSDFATSDDEQTITNPKQILI